MKAGGSELLLCVLKLCVRCGMSVATRVEVTSYLSTVYSQHKYSCLVSVFNLNLKMVIVKGQNM